MIRVTLELVPGGIGEPEHLGTIEIQNILTRSIETNGRRGDYAYEIFKKRTKSPWRGGKVRDFPRRSQHCWNLVRQILNQAAERNGGVI